MRPSLTLTLRSKANDFKKQNKGINKNNIKKQGKISKKSLLTNDFKKK